MEDFQILGGPTPYNYYPTDDSAKLCSPNVNSRVNIIRQVFHNKWSREEQERKNKVRADLEGLKLQQKEKSYSEFKKNFKIDKEYKRYSSY